MKKIIILTAGFGEGHNSAARGIRDGLQEVAPEISAEIHDIFNETYGWANRLTCRGYLAAIHRAPNFWETIYRTIDAREHQHYRVSLRWLFFAEWRLARLIAQERPAALVWVYPAYGHMLDTIYGRTNGSGPRRIVTITDSRTVNAIWFRCSADHFIVANEPTARILREAGVDQAPLHSLGFPVSPRFASLPVRQPGPPWRILVMANNRPVDDLARRLLEIPDIQLTMMAGRDRKAHRKLAALQRETQRPFDTFGWTDKLPRLFGSHHLLIGKARGATVQEAAAARLPMIINQIVPGQEEGNALLMTDSNSGVVALSNEETTAAVSRALADEARQ
ncbi:MAG: galactosyldiacylglycerol synthase, partial [Chthoniobacterales bacterium]|nr:galactosyldiacylglycerol synthase [Chthoniobacterales bacterium]